MQNRGDFAFIQDAITYQVFFSFRGGVFRTSGMIRLRRNLFRKSSVEEGLYKTIQHLPNLIANGYWRLCHDCWNKWAKVHWLKKGQKRSRSIQRLTWSVKRLLEGKVFYWKKSPKLPKRFWILRCNLQQEGKVTLLHCQIRVNVWPTHFGYSKVSTFSGRCTISNWCFDGF